jgi:SAM-dependent methyltransferase
MILAGVAVAGSVARRPLRAHLAEGTLPGRSGSRINSYFNRPSYRVIAAALHLTPEDDLLDVACGWGEFLASHASEARRVAGIDVSEEKVALARERLADRIAAGTAEVVRGDAAALPWKEGTFSAVTCMDAFPFFKAPERVLAEALRVLRPGGRMLMQIGMNWRNGRPKHMLHPSSPAAGDEAAVRRMVEAAGFREVSITYRLVGGDSRAGNLACRLTTGSDEMRLVGAVKPR